MDPVNAVGIAAAVVQFADFGFRLINSAYELYNSPSGQRSEYIELSAVSQDLSSLADAIRAKLDENQGSVGEVFTRLHRQCKSTNDELQSILSKLKVKAGSNKIELAADGLRVAFRQVAAAGDIDKLANRLNQIREQMNVGLVYLLLDEAGKNGVELRQFAKQQADMIATLDRIDTATKQFSTDIIEIIDKWPVNHQTETDEMVHYVLNNKWWTSKYAERTVVDENQDKEKLRKVFQSLYFESISHRETSIPQRHAKSFEWIFHEPQISEDGHALWSDFPLWLQSESQDIYWITGKPGAGKSTLVKFISQDSRFKDQLQKWATGSQPLIIRFFSWTSGMNKLQKSQEGLFRTLLLEAIQQRPQLAVKIFPARWFLLQSFNGNIKLPVLTMSELRDGFRNLLSATGDGLKLALLIDGLDEFDEDQRENHHDLVRLLRETNAETGVKICVSSRPWNVFRDEYRENPMLQLENLTREDIQSFVYGQLQLSPGYRDFANINQRAIHKIVTDIVDKSQGVFLWVSVISGMLEDALQEGTTISDLQATVDNLPKEVDELFCYIWNRTSKRFRAEASQYFQLIRICQEQEITLTALIVWFGDKEISVDIKATDVTSTYLSGAIKILERKLMSRTGGLLELVSHHDDYTKEPKDVRVDYMHRTANDWVRDNLASITSATDRSYDPFFWFVKGQALSVVFTTKPDANNISGLSDWPSMFYIASLVPEDYPDNGILVAALDRLDRHLVTHMRKHQTPMDCYWANHVGILSDNVKRLQDVFRHMRMLIGDKTLFCNNFLEFSAHVPIPAYLKHRVQENPYLLSTTDGYVSGILCKLVFGEILFSSPYSRLNLLDSLIRGKYCPPPALLLMVKDRIKRATTKIKSNVNPERYNDYYVDYFTQVQSMLGSRIWSPSLHFTIWLRWCEKKIGGTKGR
ncbi:NACHT domain-containing protein [Trichoderma simmonsii]|uniref:NACHT domain-containing protein n=1 Tax=Trichoderma simmonsii TaxID=1491479 RepID=A0A8G0KZ96_9HYPO|nr:NACHT domain-containing protein [Trichoderma simmonsii]